MIFEKVEICKLKIDKGPNMYIWWAKYISYEYLSDNFSMWAIPEIFYISHIKLKTMKLPVINDIGSHIAHITNLTHHFLMWFLIYTSYIFSQY